MNNIVIGITGASGSIYARRLMEVLAEKKIWLHVIITHAGRQVLNHELGWDFSGDREKDQSYLRTLIGENTIKLYDENHIGASIASGSYPIDAMVVIPASMGSISGLAHGRSMNLLERSADVMLKEKRKLIVVPRETPLNQIHLENLLRLSKLDVEIIPAMPAFYHHPKSLEDVVDFLVGRVLDHLKIDHDLFARWEG